MGRFSVRLIGATVLMGALSAVAVGAGSTAAFADTPSYELYCPGTPIGNVVLNDVVTTGTLTASGSSVNLTNYQTKVTIPQNLVTAASAFGSTLQGSATAAIDATGATPASMKSGTLQINVPIATPPAAITLQLPSPAGTIGPFTATASTVTVSVDPSTSLTLLVSGNPLTLTCNTYPNDTLPTETTQSKPSASPSSPQIATTSASAGAAPATTPTTAAPAAAPSTDAAASTLPQTGPGPGLYMVGFAGVSALLLASLVLVLGRGRRAPAPVTGGTTGRRRRP